MNFTSSIPSFLLLRLFLFPSSFTLHLFFSFSFLLCLNIVFFPYVCFLPFLFYCIQRCTPVNRCDAADYTHALFAKKKGANAVVGGVGSKPIDANVFAVHSEGAGQSDSCTTATAARCACLAKAPPVRLNVCVRFRIIAYFISIRKELGWIHESGRGLNNVSMTLHSSK